MRTKQKRVRLHCVSVFHSAFIIFELETNKENMRGMRVTDFVETLRVAFCSK